jgi:tRNA dimethylallyltransferase
MNESDSERIASFLEKKGYKKAPKMEGADLIVVAACSVRQTAIDRILGLKRKFKNLKAKKILTGCVLKSDKRKFQEFFDKILSIDDFLGKNYLDIKPKHLHKKSTFVPIMTGCNNFCSYCVVPYTRGREISRKSEEVITEIKKLVKKGHKEITLLGQNVNSYQYGFSKLLKKINALPGDFIIKFLTNHPKDFSDELIKTIADCKKVSKEIHLPVQSGDDEILKKMNRGYTVKQYKNLIKKIRKKIPNVKISTDVIVGFPSETKNQFENTVKLFKEIKFNKAYINKYSTRLGTIASKFKDNVAWKEKKRRWRILEKIANPPTPRASAGKLIAIVGPTASGKSGLAVKIAKNFRGEIISADSRQIYKEMDIGTDKITKKQMQRIAHYLLDVASPKKQITVAEYRKKALEAIDKIYKKNKIPILCGGTGFYIRAIVEGLIIPQLKPDLKLRKELEKKTTEQLFGELKKLDPRRAKEIDSKNRRRLVRALEIIIKTKKPVPELKTKPQFDVLYLGIKKSLPELKKAINKRINTMIKNGLENEVKKLIKKYGWTKVLKNAIGYSSFARAASFAEVASATKAESADKREIINDIKLCTLQFAKRQMTWFRKYPGKKINWIKDYPETEKLVKNFLL